MRSLMVVAMTPVLGHAPDLVQAGEDIAVQNLGAKGPIEAFDVGVLGLLARLDVQQFDTVPLGPLPQRSADEFRAVVQAQASGRTA